MKKPRDHQGEDCRAQGSCIRAVVQAQGCDPDLPRNYPGSCSQRELAGALRQKRLFTTCCLWCFDFIRPRTDRRRSSEAVTGENALHCTWIDGLYQMEVEPAVAAALLVFLPTVPGQGDDEHVPAAGRVP